jgi:hypothetical protein
MLIVALVALALLGAGFVAGTLANRGTKTARPERGPSSSVGPNAFAHVTAVPDLAGLNLSEAVQVLKSMGLGVGELTAHRNPWDPGVVLFQGVPAGSHVPLGQEVPLVVSAGPHPSPVVLSGQPRVGVGGTCELLWPPPSPVCVGGPLLVPFEGT